MTDHYDEMRVAPDPTRSEALRQRLHARMASFTRDDNEERTAFDLDSARVDPDELAPMKEIYVSLNTPSETRKRRRLVVAAAAAVVVVGIVGIAIANNDNDESRSPATAPTVAPTTTVASTTGTYVLSESQPLLPSESDVRLTFTVPAGWEDNDWHIDKLGSDPIVGVNFQYVANIYTDSCPSEPVSPPVGPTVDDLASAWETLPAFEATAPTDITVDGFHGKQLEFTVPNYDEAKCPDGRFKLVGDPTGGAWWAQGPNQHNQLWILDVDGTRFVIIASYYPDTPPQDRAAIEEILASLQID